jgi:hypothetical protein
MAHYLCVPGVFGIAFTRRGAALDHKAMKRETSLPASCLLATG